MLEAAPPPAGRVGVQGRGGPSYRGQGGGPGLLPQSPATPSPKMGEEGNEERGSGQREKREGAARSRLRIWVRPVAGRGEGAAIAVELRCGPTLGETTCDSPHPIRRARPRVPVTHPVPIPTAPAPGQSALYSRSELLQAPRL